MKHGTQAGAEWRALISAALLGSSVGLGLGVTYMAAGLSREAADSAAADRMAEAAGDYTGSNLEAGGRGLRTGLQRYGFGMAGRLAMRDAADRRSAKAHRRADLECLTDAVYYEARGESVRGQAAVAQVVLNRVKHPAYPKSVCGVVFQGANHRGCQFSFACDGSMRHGREMLAWNRARGVAARVLAGNVSGYVGAATHYHTTAVSPFWAPQMLRVATVGVHVFYRFAPYRIHALPAGAPSLQRAVLVSAPVMDGPEGVVAPTLEKAIEASLQPVSVPAMTPKPAEAAMLTTISPASVGGF